MPKKLRWLEIAIDDLEQAVEYVARHNQTAARKLAKRIWQSIQMLKENEAAGRPGRIAGTRELVVVGTSYIVPYRVKVDEIQILRVLHGARKWPLEFNIR